MHGMALMVLAMQIVPFTDAAAKVLVAEHGFAPLQAAWARCLLGALFLLPAGMPALPGNVRALHQALKPHWLRGACWAGATLFFFSAIEKNSMPGALALVFVAPLFVAAAAPLLLGESFSWRRLAATAAGFCGVLVVLRPHTAGFSPSLLWALLSGLCYGGYLMATRHALRQETTSSYITFMSMLTAGLLMTPPVLFIWHTPTVEQWLWMTAMGGLSALGHYLIARSCAAAGASQVAPFTYTEMFSTTAISYWFFSELPATAAWAGIALIIAAGMYVTLADMRTP